MSTIIDALKRSDRERQINTTHSMSYSHLNTEEDQSKAWIKYVLIALLVTVVCLIAIMLWFNRDKAETGPIQLRLNSTNPAEIQASENNAPEVISPKTEIAKVETPVVDTVAPIITKKSELIVKNSARSSIVKPVEGEPRSSLSDLVIIPVAKNKRLEVVQSPAEQLQKEPSVQDADFITYDNYFSIRSSQNLPELHLDILMYHPDSSQRKAFINMNAYREGEQISEGAELLEVGQKGVLLRYQGKDFVLSTN